MTVTVRAPARLAFTLVELSGRHGRLNGGAGVAVARPFVECTVTHANQIDIEIETGIEMPHAEDVLRFARRLCEAFSFSPVNIRITAAIPPHHGFGSKTATLLAVGRAVAVLNEATIPTYQLAALAERGRTSGIGVHVFDHGGFVADGGHRIGSEAQGDLVPTRFAPERGFPCLLFHGSLPWAVLVIVPFGHILEGQQELAYFESVCPLPLSDVHEIAYWTSFRMVSAVATGDYEEFCLSVNSLQHCAWKRKQMLAQDSRVRYVVDSSRDVGVDAIGLTSNGPALYAFSRNPHLTEPWLVELRSKSMIREHWWTEVPSHGSIVVADSAGAQW